ncbi:MAG: phosphoglucosamine mutase [Chloroflexi bacterium]|nr:MAG: phosphoglucosamine mutase [Chloroflexota bacterium]TMF27327.1 MAG: phosphoglucosamine mutase [Chloroflexota bacterium]
MPRLFGTDGVRGVANLDLTPELGLRLGRAAGHVLGGHGNSVVIGRDTRRSGRMLESALAAGLCSVGTEVRLVGHIPTPGLAYLAKAHDFVAGAVISASHNPAPDNGIKFFDHRAQKLPDTVEDKIEALMSGDDSLPRPTEGGIGLVGDARGLVKDYETFLLSMAPPLAGMRIALDCANGATYRVAPAVFAHAGAEVLAFFDAPNGQNINDGCGATAPEALQRLVVDHKADAGFAFDGDGDRVIVIDERGRAHNGDFVLALAARHFAKQGRLSPKLVVGTVMTNGGLESTLARDGIRLERTQVGDRYVWEAMERLGAQFGGESSGHVIFRQYSTTGDGILTALEVLHLVRAEGRRLSELADDMEFWPQVTRNVKAARRREWDQIAAFVDAKEKAEAQLGSAGRLLVRPSGTEPVLRITVEARDATLASSTAEGLARVAERELV